MAGFGGGRSGGGRAGGGKAGASVGKARASGSGHASNAALQDDEDFMARRRVNFRSWAETRKKKKITKIL
jgi:hypothetical protein